MSEISALTGLTNLVSEKRIGIGIGGVLSYLYGSLEIFVLAILVTIIISDIKNLTGYDSDASLQRVRQIFFGFTIFFWIAFSLNTIFIVFFMFFYWTLLTIPYVAFFFIILNIIISIALITYSFFALNTIRGTKDYENYSKGCGSGDQACEAAGKINNLLFGIIGFTILSIVILGGFGIYAVVVYKPSEDIKLAVDVAAPEVGVVEGTLLQGLAANLTNQK